MMNSIVIEWKGDELVIGESEAFEVGEAIEEIVSLTELSEMGSRPKFHKLARCYAVMINHAGGEATPAEVHKMMMDEVKGASPQHKRLIAVQAVSTLIAILMDGAPAGGGASKGKPTSGSSKDASK